MGQAQPTQQEALAALVQKGIIPDADKLLQDILARSDSWGPGQKIAALGNVWTLGTSERGVNV